MARRPSAVDTFDGLNMSDNKDKLAFLEGFATLDIIVRDVIAGHLQPAPTEAMLRHWFRQAKITKFQYNPSCRGGGGNCFYNLNEVRAFFRDRTGPARDPLPRHKDSFSKP